MADVDGDIKQAIVSAGHELHRQGLAVGTSGNLSARDGERVWVTPSAYTLAELSVTDLVAMNLDEGTVAEGDNQPTSEWFFHEAIYAMREDVGGIVHLHPRYCTALACSHLDIPPLHYMIALSGGSVIPCAPYATFGTPELAAQVVTTLGDDLKACLLANHGMVAVGDTVKAATDLALVVEELAEQYWRALQVGGPVLLTDEEMGEVFERFGGYGKKAEA